MRRWVGVSCGGLPVPAVATTVGRESAGSGTRKASVVRPMRRTSPSRRRRRPSTRSPLTNEPLRDRPSSETTHWSPRRSSSACRRETSESQGSAMSLPAERPIVTRPARPSSSSIRCSPESSRKTRNGAPSRSARRRSCSSAGEAAWGASGDSIGSTPWWQTRTPRARRSPPPEARKRPVCGESPAMPSYALTSQLDDERLVALVRAGRDDAFAAIHNRYRDRLLAFARRLLSGTGHDAEDVVQDAFIRALAGLRATDATMNLKPWLYMIVRNRAMDELRRPARAVAELDDVAHLRPAEDADPAGRPAERERVRDVAVAPALDCHRAAMGRGRDTRGPTAPKPRRKARGARSTGAATRTNRSSPQCNRTTPQPATHERAERKKNERPTPPASSSPPAAASRPRAPWPPAAPSGRRSASSR